MASVADDYEHSRRMASAYPSGEAGPSSSPRCFTWNLIDESLPGGIQPQPPANAPRQFLPSPAAE